MRQELSTTEVNTLGSLRHLIVNILPKVDIHATQLGKRALASKNPEVTSLLDMPLDDMSDEEINQLVAKLHKVVGRTVAD